MKTDLIEKNKIIELSKLPLNNISNILNQNIPSSRDPLSCLNRSIFSVDDKTGAE